jgi:hypothetical protein
MPRIPSSSGIRLARDELVRMEAAELAACIVASEWRMYFQDSIGSYAEFHSKESAFASENREK